jgi:hypothetical protein
MRSPGPAPEAAKECMDHHKCQTLVLAWMSADGALCFSAANVCEHTDESVRGAADPGRSLLRGGAGFAAGPDRGPASATGAQVMFERAPITRLARLVRRGTGSRVAWHRLMRVWHPLMRVASKSHLLARGVARGISGPGVGTHTIQGPSRGTGVTVTRGSPKPLLEVRFLGPPLRSRSPRLSSVSTFAPALPSQGRNTPCLR